MDTLEEDKRSLIDLIIWYRDDYHKGDFGHNEWIEKVKRAKSSDDLNLIEVIVDGWLHY